jgi:hypothetical protein
MSHREICGCFPRTSVEAHTSGCQILKEGSSHEALCWSGLEKDPRGLGQLLDLLFCDTQVAHQKS